MLGEEEKFVNHELRVTDAINDWFLTNQDARGTVKPVSKWRGDRLIQVPQIRDII